MAKHARADQGASGKRNGRSFWTAVMWIALCVFLVSVGYLGFIAYSYWSDAHRYDEIAQTAFEPSEEDGLAAMGVDWDALRKINPEVVAWVYVPGTRISYPVCYSGDNVKYLDMNFDGNAGVFTGSGAIFLDGDAKPNFSCDANFLFGHHMNDGSMFACLSDFADEAVFEKSRTIYVLTPAMNYEFNTFALVRTVGTDYLVVHEFKDDAEKVKYLSDKESRSLVEPKEGFPKPQGMKKIIALSTCDYNEADGRAILYGHMVDLEVPASNATEIVGDAEGYVAPEE
jgi:sortase B